MTWTPERIELVKNLWQEGLTTSAIARKVGVSKNAVVGKVHRLGLPGRESPIRHKPSKVVGMAKGAVCHWPLGEPGADGFGFCGKPAAPGKPYCAEHCDAAYIRAPRREKAADAA
ncbi:MAG TPA: GcrA family cell cycle regulator [Alphaproteobacteria bacterium]|nr:GcrA family cell cycle regulator [Alphaproteobacteria bacterium]